MARKIVGAVRHDKCMLARTMASNTVIDAILTHRSNVVGQSAFALRALSAGQPPLLRVSFGAMLPPQQPKVAVYVDIDPANLTVTAQYAVVEARAGAPRADASALVLAAERGPAAAAALLPDVTGGVGRFWADCGARQPRGSI